MDKLFIGSNNTHKISEINDIFTENELFFDIRCPKDFNCLEEPVENGMSFRQNSLIKAKFYYDLFHLPTLGEDSGICIEYFNDMPGIHSKRFLSHLNDCDKNEYILEMMKDVKNRKARFFCDLCYIDENGNIHYFEGINEGEVALKQTGNEGFGYDPIFYIPAFKKTEAQLGNEWKNHNSHRAKAFSKFIDYVKNK